MQTGSYGIPCVSVDSSSVDGFTGDALQFAQLSELMLEIGFGWLTQFSSPA